MTDDSRTMLPFHIWCEHQREEAHARAAAFTAMTHGYAAGSEMQLFATNMAWLMDSHATLLNVLGTDAAARYAADVKGQQDKPVARPPDEHPQLRMYIFQDDYQTFAFGLTEAAARKGGRISDVAVCLGCWH